MPPEGYKSWPGPPGGTAEEVRAILQGSNARKTARFAVFGENGKASAFPRASFQVYYLNARSAFRNKYSAQSGTVPNCALLCITVHYCAPTVHSKASRSQARIPFRRPAGLNSWGQFPTVHQLFSQCISWGQSPTVRSISRCVDIAEVVQKPANADPRFKRSSA